MPSNRAGARRAPPFIDPPGYVQHRPEQTLLYQIIEQHYPAFLAAREAAGRLLPKYVQEEFEAYRKCGRLEHGFLRVKCEACHAEKLVAFSCQGRGFCPSCGARRMAETAALLVDEVLPARPLRQWVLSLPFALRFLLATDPDVLTQVLGIVYRGISGHILEQAGLSRSAGDTGAVTLIQRFGSALNANVHLHMLVLDGAYLTGTHPPVFRRIAAPSARELQALVQRIAERIGRALERKGLLVRDCENSYLTFDPAAGGAMDDLLGHSITYRVAVGPRTGQKVFTLQTVPAQSDEALHEHVQLSLLRQQLHLDLGTRLLPRLGRKFPLELAQPPLRRADQIARPALAHLGEVLLRRDATVHNPDALCLPVARLDPLEKPRQRRAVGRVPGHDLVGQRETLRRHDQRDHHLHTVAAVIAAVAIATLVLFRKRRIALKVRAGEVVQQHIELHPKQILPALLQKPEQRLLVLEQFIQAPVQRVFSRERIVFLKQVSHRAARIPLPVQPPLAPRINQPVRRQYHQDVVPRGPFARVEQPGAPKLIQLQLLRQLHERPARSPLPRALQTKLRQPHPHAKSARVLRNCLVGREQS